jgi:hypothetical protein
MAKNDWKKEDFHICSNIITYQSKFVARFKYSKNGIGDFKKFLVANFTPAEYFGMLDAGQAPICALETKGYVVPHIRKELARLGYPVTLAGFKQMIKDQISARQLVAKN